MPVYPDLELRLHGDGVWTMHKVPPFVCSWAGAETGEIEGIELPGPFGTLGQALVSVANEVLGKKDPVEGYCVEFKDSAGNEKAVLIRAWDPFWDRKTVLVRFHDVSTLLQAQKKVEQTHGIHGIIGKSKAIQDVIRRIEVYGPFKTPCLITGETGTGKELVARALHKVFSRDGTKPFVAMNCASISEDLFESELFGHEKGSFTGAVKLHKGRFERANGGTLFLDELAEMPLKVQAKLLRALEYGTIERVGGEEEIKVDVRVIAATNRPIEQLVAKGGFREDLYHRIAVLRINVPPLRERKEDIPLLVDFFLNELSNKYGKRILRLTRQAMAVLLSYTWPGNVRELKNALERIFIESRSVVIGWRALEQWVRERALLASGKPPSMPNPEKPIPLPQKSIAREDILEALEASGWNASEAARKLGIHRATLYRYMKHHGIERPKE